MQSVLLLGSLDFKMFFNLDKNLRACHQTTPTKTTRCQNKENSKLLSCATFAPIFSYATLLQLFTLLMVFFS